MQNAWILIVTSIIGGQEYSAGTTTTYISGGDPVVSVARFNTQTACEEIAKRIGGTLFSDGIAPNVSAECVMVFRD